MSEELYLHKAAELCTSCTHMKGPYGQRVHKEADPFCAPLAFYSLLLLKHPSEVIC